MKKIVSTLLAGFALGVFFFVSCETGTPESSPGDPLSNFVFTPEELGTDAALQGASAGSFSAEGGRGSLAYSLVSGDGDGDNARFAVEGNSLKITAAGLSQGAYLFRARAEDERGETLDKAFTLTVGPAGGGGGPENPDAPEVPDVPENPDLPGGPEDPDAPDVPDLPGGPEDPDAPDLPDTPNGPGDPGTPQIPPPPGDPGDPGDQPAKPARAALIDSTPGMNRVHLSWPAAARATSYAVYYSTGSVFSGAAKYSEEPTEPTVTVMGLAAGTVYNFWVVAKNAEGSADESNRHTAIKTGDEIDRRWFYAPKDGVEIRIDLWDSTTDGYYFYNDPVTGESMIYYSANPDLNIDDLIGDAGTWPIHYHIKFDPERIKVDVPSVNTGHYTTAEDLTVGIDGGPPASGVFIVYVGDAPTHAGRPYYAVYYWGGFTPQNPAEGKTAMPGPSVHGTMHSYLSNAWSTASGAPVSNGGHAATLKQAIATYTYENFKWFVAGVAVPWYPKHDGEFIYAHD